MDIRQVTLDKPDRLDAALGDLADPAPDWVLVFASPAWLTDPSLFARLRAAFPAATLSGCSTAGEIGAGGVSDKACVITAIRLDGRRPPAAASEIAAAGDSLAAGRRLGNALAKENPRAVLVFAPGVDVNGSALIDGMAATLPAGCCITGGLAGDDGAFRQTWTLGDQGISPRAAIAVAIPASLAVSHGSFGGWKPFGPTRKITRAAGNVLHELDGQPALEVYKRYLGDYARDLPASGLLFPFEMLGSDREAVGLIRTILGVDEANGSLILAGDVSEGGHLRLMHASTDGLVDGAEVAAQAARPDAGNGIALLVSCVGRKLVMGGRVDEEVEAVAETLGADMTVAGFYSYGEISPLLPDVGCKLHNQTMTITCIVDRQ